MYGSENSLQSALVVVSRHHRGSFHVTKNSGPRVRLSVCYLQIKFRKWFKLISSIPSNSDFSRGVFIKICLEELATNNPQLRGGTVGKQNYQLPTFSNSCPMSVTASHYFPFVRRSDHSFRMISPFNVLPSLLPSPFLIENGQRKVAILD